MTNTHHFDAIGVNLRMLSSYLSQAERAVEEALTHHGDGNQNGAIGAILEVHDQLEHAKGLYHAIIAIHRNARRF